LVRITVVIPALDEAAGIEPCVASARDEDVEVIVVDGGSQDATRVLARRAGARVVSAAAGRAHQLEAGWRLATGEVVLFLHSDTQLPGGYAATVRAALRDSEVVGGAFSFRFDRRDAILRFVEWGARMRLRLFAFPYGDQALFARRVALEALGGVPQVSFMEDLDLVRALKEQGRLALLPLCATTSARRYLAGGVLRTMLRNWVAAAAWLLGVDRSRVAAWYRR
jgi:rSAM/selenodomain-associated transferase 2